MIIDGRIGALLMTLRLSLIPPLKCLVYEFIQQQEQHGFVSW
jgi:hypothetical protein